jgi:acetyltransferase-like isoleucine patch superfamily enzyme
MTSENIAVASSGRRRSAAWAYYLFNYFITWIPSYRIRHGYLRAVLRIRLGRGASVQMGCFFGGRLIEIGDRTVINRRCRFDGRVPLRIGSDCSISPECAFYTLSHDAQDPDFKAVPGPITVGDRVWLGARALILPGVNLGEGSVVGAGSVVTRSVDPFIIVAGNPARKIGERNPDLRYRLHYFPALDSDIQIDT